MGAQFAFVLGLALGLLVSALFWLFATIVDRPPFTEDAE